MSTLDRCRYATSRLRVAPWHADTDDDDLAGVVREILTTATTARLPWGPIADDADAQAWISERDAESNVLLARERRTGSPIGLLLVAGAGDSSDLDLQLGYVLGEMSWGRGLASEMVGGFVAWCRAVGRVRSISAGVADDHIPSARVLGRHGFRRAGADRAGNVHHRLDLRPGTVVRAETPADHGAIRTVVSSAFGSPAEADLVDRIRASGGHRPELSLVAELDGEVVGHVMISEATIRSGDRVLPVAMLSPLAVAPAHHRHGIGELLVRGVLARAADAGERIVVLEGDPAYYGRFGFEPARPLGIELPLPDWAPVEAGQVVVLDGRSEPAVRGTVVYPPAFDGLD